MKTFLIIIISFLFVCSCNFEDDENQDKLQLQKENSDLKEKIVVLKDTTHSLRNKVKLLQNKQNRINPLKDLEIYCALDYPKDSEKLYGQVIFMKDYKNEYIGIGNELTNIFLSDRPYFSLYQGGEKIGLLRGFDAKYLGEIEFNKVFMNKNIIRGMNIYGDKYSEYTAIASTNHSLKDLGFKKQNPSTYDKIKTIELATLNFHKKYNTNVNSDSIVIVRLDVFNNSTESSKLVATCRYEDVNISKENRPYLFFYVDNYTASPKIDFLNYSVFKDNTKQGKSTELIDICDIDNDRELELIIVTHGYESKVISIIKKVNGKWIKIFVSKDLSMS